MSFKNKFNILAFGSDGFFAFIVVFITVITGLLCYSLIKYDTVRENCNNGIVVEDYAGMPVCVPLDKVQVITGVGSRRYMRLSRRY